MNLVHPIDQSTVGAFVVNWCLLCFELVTLIWKTGAIIHVSNDSIQRRSTFTHIKRNGICSWQTNKKHSEFTIKSMPTQTAGRVADMPSSIMKHSLLYHPYECKKKHKNGIVFVCIVSEQNMRQLTFQIVVNKTMKRRMYV